MANALIRVFIFLIATMVTFTAVGWKITDLSGGERKASAVEGVNAEAGEQIFFGKGRCYTCHSIGDRGSAIRCPNMGIKGEKFDLMIGERATVRAAERTKQTGKHFRAVDYLFECVGEPGAYVVEGYKNEMPYTYKAPIGLQPDDIKAVLMFLSSQGEGEITPEQILNPTGIAKEYFAKVEAAASSGEGGAAEAFEPYLEGDPAMGKEIFWGLQSKTPCAKCHTVNGKGGKVGPDITNVAATRTIKFIIESILKPSAEIASGFEPVLVLTNEGKRISGTKKGETDAELKVGIETGEVVTIPKSDIKKWKKMKKSIMPGNFRELLSVDDLHNVVAYLKSLVAGGGGGEAAEGGDQA
ncbi:MAG: c-type cytochrome [Nitrospinota bacterium]